MDGIILVNKPSGITSHDLVQKARRKLNIAKIGHTGTLDPLASGLMILTIGKSTKILTLMSHYFKEYICEMRFGLKTTTLDIEGEVVENAPIKTFTKETIIEVLNSFLGTSMQVPPMYSAKKVNGRHLYDLARENIEVERAAIPINIKEIELLEMHEEGIKFRVLCSTGTYIRVLTQDIASKLDTIATMTSLKRTKIDKYNVEDAYELEQLDNSINVLSNYEVLKDYPYIEFEDVKAIMNGKRIKIDCEEQVVIITNNKQCLAAYEKSEDGYYYTKRGLW